MSRPRGTVSFQQAERKDDRPGRWRFQVKDRAGNVLAMSMVRGAATQPACELRARAAARIMLEALTAARVSPFDNLRRWLLLRLADALL